MARSRLSLTIAATALLGGCATQPDYSAPVLPAPAAWANGSSTVASTSIAPLDRGSWWTRLEDPAIDGFVDAALRDNPTLVEAAARVDQAASNLAIRRASRVPRIDLDASVGAARVGGDPGGGGTIGQTSASIGPTLSWELDLWGRVRGIATAARRRLDARDADAEDARLSIVAQIASATLELRACDYLLRIRDADIASREVELSISRQRLSFGNIAPFEVANARSNLATARTDRISQTEECVRLVNALVALSGLDARAVRALAPPAAAIPPDLASAIPSPPPLQPAIPATVLLANPTVIAAERELAARWAEIGVARAERLPRVDLTAILTGQWIRALGSGDTSVTGSLGPGLTVPLFDGGAGRANIRFADARYREGLATLGVTIRAAVRDIEDGLAAQTAAIDRIGTTREAVDAAAFTLRANEARRRAGSIAQFELEESRRQLNRSREAAVVAARDRARAWVDLVRRTGFAPAPRELPGLAATASAPMPQGLER